MMTVKKLIESLSKLPQDMPVFAMDSASGVVSPVGSIYARAASETDAEYGGDIEDYIGQTVALLNLLTWVKG